MKVERQGKRRYLIIAIAVLMALTAYVFYRIKKHDFLDHQLQDLVQQKTNQLYKLHYDSISVDEAGGDVYIKDLYIKGDTARQLQLISAHDTNAAKVIFDIYIPALKVVGFKTAGALLSKQLDCRQVIISRPQVKMYLFPGQGKQKDSKKQQEELYRQILGNFKVIRADSISIVNSEVVASDFYTKQVKFHTYNTSVNLSDVAIDSTYNQDTSRTLFCKQIAITSDKVILGEKKNTAEITKATFDTRSKIVAFSSFEYDAFKNNGFFKGRLEGVSLQGIEWKGPAENSDLTIDKAVFDKGVIEALSGNSESKKSDPKKKDQILSGWIKNFSLNSLLVRSVAYTSRPVDAKQKSFTIKNNSFLIKNINIDRTAELNESLVTRAKEIELTNDEISLKSADNLYEFKVSGIRLNTLAKSIFVKSVKVIPQLSEAAFAKKKHYQTDRYDIKFNNINCSDVDFQKLMKGELKMRSLSTSDNSIAVFRDLAYPVDSISVNGQQQTYPHQLIHKLSVPIDIKRFIASNTYIEYKEKNARSKNSGRVRFSKTDVTINNVSNHKAKTGEKMTARFTTNFLDEIPLNGGFTFYTDKWTRGDFTAEASINKSIDATIFNQLLQPMSLAKVEKGVIRSVKFYMAGDTNTSRATLVMPYNDLKISFLRKKENKYNKKGIFSFLANIIVRNNNKEGDNLRTGKITLHHNKYRSFFTFIWSSVFTGIKDVLLVKI